MKVVPGVWGSPSKAPREEQGVFKMKAGGQLSWDVDQGSGKGLQAGPTLYAHSVAGKMDAQHLSRAPAEGAGSGPPKEHRPLAFKELIGWGRLEGDHHPVPLLPSMGGSKRQR